MVFWCPYRPVQKNPAYGAEVWMWCDGPPGICELKHLFWEVLRPGRLTQVWHSSFETGEILAWELG